MIPILQYHQISDLPAELDPWGLVISPAQFERQMSYLDRTGFRCLSLGEAVNLMRTGGRAPRRSFVLTFDDGYSDLHTTVWPILARHGFTATVFVVAGRVGCQRDWNLDDKRKEGPASLLSWTEISDLIRAGISIGSHTVTHACLTQLGEDGVRRELRDSKALLEDRLGTPVDYLAYPYNRCNDLVRQIAAESGYAAACGGDRGPWDWFHMWRSGCQRADSAQTFAWKATGGHYRQIWLHEQTVFGKWERWMRQTARPVRSLLRRPGGLDSRVESERAAIDDTSFQ